MKYKLNSWAQVLIVGLLFRLFVIQSVPLADDETYHWTWAKSLSWSYFDHPGMVAWVMWPFITIFGDGEVAVRTAGFLLFLGIMFLVYKTSESLFDRRVARLSTLLLFVIPLWGFASLGTLPDLPLAFFWMMMVYFFWQSVKPDQPWSVKKSWLLIGVSMGFGMNSKLSACLLGLGMGLYLLLTPRVRKHLLSPWPYVATLITFVMMTPVFWWNSHHEWASFQYQFFRRHHEALGADFSRWLQFWTYQWIFMSPGIYALMLVTLFWAFKKIKDERWRLIATLPLPSLILFYYQPLMAAYKPHWSGPSYMILLIGACYLFLQFSKTKKWVVGSLVAAGLIPFNLLYIPLLSPVIPKIYAQFNDPNQWDPLWDFSNELYGWKELGIRVTQLQAEIKQREGGVPLLGAHRYELISQLQYATGQKVWRISNEVNQFYFEQSPEQMNHLIGQSLIVVATDKYNQTPESTAHFERCEKEIMHSYRGVIKSRTFYIYTCHGFKEVFGL